MSNDLGVAIERLRNSGMAIERLVTGLSEEEYRWKPTPDRWSVLEVLAHLCDEEQLDFRQRLDYTLHRPGQAWPPIDPQGWVVQRSYNEMDAVQTVTRFRKERDESIAWLRHLDKPGWDLVYRHPSAGELTAADLLASWVAHDLLHIRQIVGLLHEMVGRSGRRTDYAGDW
jgi:uncharacterized damage-inducible protein DinB